MRKITGTLLLLAFPAVQAHAQTRSEPVGASFSVNVNLIKVPLSVFDERGRMVRDLRPDDFRLYENGVPQQIRSFGLDVNPVSVVLMIDTSGTVRKELKKIKEAAESFAAALSADDRISIVRFSDDVDVALNWTDDKKLVRKALRKLEPGLRTALYDAMFTGAHELLKDVEGRKAIILLTDGLNNQSSLGFQDAALSVIQSQASLYVVAKTQIVRQAAYRQRRVVMLRDIYKKMFGDDNYVEEFFRKREAELTDLAEKTGGRAFFPSDYDEIRSVYDEVARELKSKYYLTYVSNQDREPGTFHRIGLEYFPPFSKITYRQGYYYRPSAIHKKQY